MRRGTVTFSQMPRIEKRTVTFFSRALLCERLGRPSLRPGRYFRLLLVGYFEGLNLERAIAWRVSDSASVRDFLEYDPSTILCQQCDFSRLLPRAARALWSFLQAAPTVGRVMRVYRGIACGRRTLGLAGGPQASSTKTFLIRVAPGVIYCWQA